MCKCMERQVLKGHGGLTPPTYLEVQDPASILDDAWHLNNGLPASLKLGRDPIATGDVCTDLDEGGSTRGTQ